MTGAGENGSYRAVLELLARLDTDESQWTIGTLSSDKDASLSAKTFAADSYLNADGTLNTESTGDLNVVFIGGSLTQGHGTPSGEKVWNEKVADYIQSTIFPNKNVHFVNSGIGGTNSEGGAARFCEHVAPHDPDIIFIDFTVNDDMNGFSEEQGQVWLENFLYQCSQLDKIPTVVYLHTPAATMPDSKVYERWEKQVGYKEELAAHYGISTINIYDYSYGKFEKELAEGKTSADYITWLDTYYGTLQDEVVGDNGKYGRYDVHGGYQLYEEALIAALSANAQEILQPFKLSNDYLQAKHADKIERTYEKLSNDNEIFNYSQTGWTHYTAYDASVHASGDLGIPSAYWRCPFITEGGIRQGSAGATMTFETSANSITVYYQAVGTNSAGEITIYVNGTKIATHYNGSDYVQPFISSSFDLNNPNNDTVTVEIKVTKNYYRFMSFWMGYNE